MPRNTETPVTFRSPGVELGLDARGESRGLVAKRDLGRYYELLRRTLATVDLTIPEASLICDACKATLWEGHTVTLLWAQISDAIALDGLAAKWQVDAPSLVEKLRSLSYAQTLAVIDATERFWQDPNAAETAELLKRVGLVR